MSKYTIEIRGRSVGDGEEPYIIAEMSANHAGSLSRAKEIIRAAKESGADCVKIQTYRADTITIDCRSDIFYLSSGTWKGEYLYDLYTKAFTPWEWQAELKAEADRVGIDLFSTPFDPTAVDFLDEIGVEFYKIASFELVDIPLIRYTASKGKPMIMSTGMATLEEIRRAVETAREAGAPGVALLRCASSYPALPDDMNLAAMAAMREELCVPVGLSDHSMGSVGAVAAVALGASIIEKHFCLDRSIENPDSSFSMEPEEFAAMAKDARAAWRAVGEVRFGPSKNESTAFRRSLFVVRDVAEGEELTTENVRSIRPSNGLEPRFLDDVLGRRASRALKRGEPLAWDMIV